MIRNFACDLVLPEFDNEIDRMLREYRAHSPELYLIDKIQKRTMELRGHLVYWS